MNALETFKKFHDERWNADLVARQAHAQGKKIVGYADVNCPEELIMAAGCMPLLMTGTPDSDLATAGPRVDKAASLPARYLYDAILTGRYEFVDLICTMGGDRWIANTHGFLQEEKRLDPALRFGQLFFLERLRTTYKQHRDFNLDRLRVFRTFLEEFSGNKISEASIAAACAVTNETRSLLKQVSKLRQSTPPRISGCAALTIIMASMLMPKAEYNVLLRQFLDREVDLLPYGEPDPVRIFMSGSIVDNLQLYELIESLPVIIVGEDTALGDRYAEEQVSTVTEPMEALADRYTYKPLDPWMLGMRERIRYRVDATLAAGAQGVIFFHLRHDDCIAWDYPDQKRELEQHGIPVLAFDDQDYKITNPEAIRSRVAAFISTLQGRAKPTGVAA